MFASIPFQRQLLYLIFLGALPLLIVSVYLFFKHSQISELERTLQEVQTQAILREKKQAVNMALRQFYKDADRFYIDKQLESLTLLQPETDALQKIANQSHLIVDENVKKRLEFLSTENHLVFSEGAVQNYPYFRETPESLVHSVEADVEDVQEILSKIEGVEIGKYKPGASRPQLIITDFKLDRKNVHDKNEVFSLDLKFIKREFF